MDGKYKICQTIEDVKSAISSEDNSFDVHLESELPETSTSENYILGIDEAGRGPVLGKKKKVKITIAILMLNKNYHYII